MEQARIFLACPHYGLVEWGVAAGVMQCSRSHDVTVKSEEFSLLACNFNRLWCEALNRRDELRLTHFAMMHSDIAPEPWWLDLLIEEQRRIEADVLSCVLPIKSDKGRSSTGVYNLDTGRTRRLTMTEVTQLQPTFCGRHLDLSKREIFLVNTGLWICDFTQPWVEQVHFEVIDRIVKKENGLFEAQTLPEDWGFSIQCAKLGVKVAATRIVNADHFGRKAYNNQEVWGEEMDSGGM